MTRDRLLKQVKTRLKAVYGDRLQGVVLYGSEARGDAESDSDIDLLVLLEGQVQLGRDARTIIDALYSLMVRIGRPIHAQPVEAADFEAGQYSLYRNARREGVRV
jgi:predicted nucleotidyltransferase